MSFLYAFWYMQASCSLDKIALVDEIHYQHITILQLRRKLSEAEQLGRILKEQNLKNSKIGKAQEESTEEKQSAKLEQDEVKVLINTWECFCS